MNKSSIESILQAHGFDDFRWIEPREIVVAQWVRMKCRFGCAEYGKNACCPPNTPEVPECERFFQEYHTALVVHCSGTVERPEERHAWTREINRRLVKVERDVFLAGYRKAFVLYLDSCCMCEGCAALRTECKNPRAARPAPEAMAVDVFTTVSKVGYPIAVLRDYTAEMNRYGLLMIA